MKRSILPLVFLSLTVPAAFAQTSCSPAAPAQNATAPHQHHMRDPQKMAEKMSQRLGLSPDQTAKLEPILAARQQKMMELRNDTSLTPEQKHKQMRAANKEAHDQLATVLTPEQMAKMKEMRHEHMREHMHGQGQKPETQPQDPPANPS